MSKLDFEPYTVEEALVQHARDLLMSRGFMSAVELATAIIAHIYKMGDENEGIDIPKLIEESIADGEDFHKVEYSNSVVSYRIKDLFYYRPKGVGRKKR